MKNEASFMLKIPFAGTTVAVRTVDGEGETVDVSQVKIVHVVHDYGREGWHKSYGVEVNTGRYVSFWEDQIVWPDTLSDGTTLEECVIQ